MKRCIYFLLLVITVGLYSCYPSDPEVSPFVGEWKVFDGKKYPMLNLASKIKITNEYFFLNADLIPDYRYTMDDEAFYVKQIWKNKDAEDYQLRCPYSFRNDTLFIYNFAYDELAWEYVHVELTKIIK